MSCKLILNDEGEVVGAKAPDGTPSLLFKALKEITNSAKKASELTLLTHTEKFKEAVINPILARQRNLVRGILKIKNSYSVNTSRGVTTLTNGENKAILKPYKDGFTITSVDTEDLRKQAVNYALKQGKAIYTNAESLNLPSVDGKIEAYPSQSFDENKEVKPELVLDYIRNSKIANRGLSFEQKQEVKNSLLATGFNDSESLLEKLTSVFYVDGVFSPQKENLKSIYSEYEVNNILSDKNLQKTIKKTIESFKNTATPIIEDSYYDKNYLVKNTRVNSLGFMEANNPLDVEQQTVDILGGISDENEFANQLETLSEATNLDPQTVSYNKMQEYKRMKSYRVVGDLMVRVNANNTVLTLEQTLALPENIGISDDIIYLNSLPQDIYAENIQDVRDLILEIEKKAAKQGIDIVGLNEKINGENRDDIYDILEDVNNLTLEPSQEAIDNFSQKYNQLFNVVPNLVEVVEKVKPSRMKNALLHLETSIAEYDLFNKFGLIKIAKDTYQKVKKTANLDEMYDKLYQIAQYNQGILPLEAFPLANEDGVLNLSALRNPENKETIIADMKSFIEKDVTRLDVPSKGVENSELQQMLLFKYYFNTAITSKKEISLLKENQNYNAFIGNEGYLTSDYISDFYSEYLQEKIKKSEVFNNFYSKFSINERGIRLEKTDGITVGIIEDYLNAGLVRQAENFRNYSLLSRQMPTFKTTTETSEINRDSRRNIYSSNPNSLDLSRDSYTRHTDTTVSIKGATEGFIRLRDGVYEMITAEDGNTFYEKLYPSSEIYKTYNAEQPTLSVDPSQFGAQEATENKEFTTVEKNFSKKEEEEINSNFECL